MAKKTEELQYQNREALDGELAGAVADILSAEAEARKIIEQAEASGKAVRLDGAARERDLREMCEHDVALRRDILIADARAKADAECKRLVAEADAQGNRLIKDKQPIIKKRAAELLDGIRILGE